MTRDAVEKAVKGRLEWERYPFEEKAGVFLRAADLLSSDSYRFDLYTSTYLHTFLYIST